MTSSTTHAASDALGAVDTPEPMPPLEYHRLAHASQASARWWRPLAVLGTAAGLYLAMCAVALVCLGLGSIVLPEPWLPSEMLDDPTNPLDILLMLGLIAAMLPAAVLASRWAGRMRGAIHSIAGRVRWGMLWRATAMVLPLFAVIHVATFLILPPANFTVPPADVRTVLVFMFVLLLGPLQSAAEEYAFRALPMQSLGTWLRSPWWGIVLPVPFFMVGHGYNWVGQIDIAVFALCMGFLVWKSGGIELAIVVHASNNLILFLLAPFSPTSLQQGAVDPRLLLIAVPLTLVVTAGLTLWVSQSHGLRFMEPLRRERGFRPARASV